MLCPNAALCEQVKQVADSLVDGSGKPLVITAQVSSSQPPPFDIPDIVVTTPASLINCTQGSYFGPEWTRGGILARQVRLSTQEVSCMLNSQACKIVKHAHIMRTPCWADAIAWAAVRPYQSHTFLCSIRFQLGMHRRNHLSPGCVLETVLYQEYAALSPPRSLHATLLQARIGHAPGPVLSPFIKGLLLMAWMLKFMTVAGAWQLTMSKSA